MLLLTIKYENLTTNRFSIVMHDLLKMPFIEKVYRKLKLNFHLSMSQRAILLNWQDPMQYLLFIMYTHHVQ